MPTHGAQHKIGKNILNMSIIVKTNNESKIINEDKVKKKDLMWQKENSPIFV
jgi:hypothetical protein